MTVLHSPRAIETAPVVTRVPRHASDPIFPLWAHSLTFMDRDTLVAQKYRVDRRQQRIRRGLTALQVLLLILVVAFGAVAGVAFFTMLAR